MSHETDPQQPAPRSKASNSTIIEAFKNLTGGNKNRKSGQVLPPAGPVVGTSRDFFTSSVIGSSSGINTKGGHETQQGRRGSAIKSGYVGAPPELVPLLGQLSSKSNTVNQRIQAARGVTKIVANYPTEDVESIWTCAEDLLDLEYNDSTVGEIYALMLACVNHKTLTPRERVMFLEAIRSDDRSETLGLRIKTLSALTSDGRYLDHLEFGIASLLVHFLEASFDHPSLKKTKSDTDTNSSGEPSCLYQTFEYILALVKFSAKVLAEGDIEKLLGTVLHICRNAHTKRDLKNGISVIDALFTYSLIPDRLLPQCLDFLCITFRNIPSQSAFARKTIHKLLNSHLGPAAIQIMYEIIREASTEKEYSPRGAALILHGLMNSEEPIPSAEVVVTDFLAALADSVMRSSVICKSSFLVTPFQVLLDTLERKDASEVLSDPAVRANFSIVLAMCRTKREHIRQRSAAGSTDGIDLETIDQIATRINYLLTRLYGNTDDDDKPMVMEIIMTPPLESIDEGTARSVIGFHVEHQLLQPPTEAWFTNCQRLRSAFFVGANTSHVVRLECLKALSDAYKTVDALNMADASTLVTTLASYLEHEQDDEVAEALCEFLVEVWTWSDDKIILETILQRFQAVLPPMSSSRTSLSRPTSQEDGPSPSTRTVNSEVMQRTVAALVRMFMRTLRRSSWKSQQLYIALLDVADNASIPAAARITAFKLLVRLRTDVNYAVFIIPDPGCETLAAALCRTKTTYKEEPNMGLESPLSRPVRTEDSNSRRKYQSAPAASSRTPSRSVSRLSRPPLPTPPAWIYGKFKGLPEEPPHIASHLFCTHVDTPGEDNQSIKSAEPESRILKINTWLEMIIALLQQKDLDWEIYSYLICHVGAQLTNHSLFINSVPQLRLLRNVLCSQLLNKTFFEPPAPTNLKKGDVAVCLYDILTMLVSYRTHFTKGEQEEMVKVFVTGIGTLERTSEFCIHALFICCLELPIPTTKSLDTALQKMTQIITQASVAAHVLEFLAGLARLPALFNHFSEVEYKKVFAICFRYLQFVRDQRRKSTPANTTRSTNNNSPGPNVRVNRDSGIQLDTSLKERSLADELPQYVYALAFHVLTFFFMSLRLSHRAQYLDWIAQSLVYRNEDGKEVMEEQAQVTLDYMRRIAYSDRDETVYEPNFATVADGIVSKKSWVWGSEVLTIETAGRTGVSQLTRRRPAGTKFTVLRPQLVPPARHSTPITYGSAADAFYTTDYVGVTPDDVLQEMYSQYLAYPTPLPNDEATNRSISSIDRIPALDGHKVGIIYIGEGQTVEAKILANVMGSEDYTAFLNGIGTLTRLQGSKMNCQGLDREADTDGKFTYAWRNRVTELVFHVTTLMPTNLDADPQCSQKKRHTGNDFVNIIFNNSGIPFDFNTFPSAFNFVNIVIVPEARTSFVDTRQRAAALRRRRQRQITPSESTSYFADPPTETLDADLSDLSSAHSDPIYTDLFYKVTVHVKEGLPAISPASETKMISGGCLPEFVRLLALNASVFAQVWANKDSDEHISSWRSRLREIMRLRERHAGPTVPPMPTIYDRELAPTTTPFGGSQLLSPLVAPINPFSPSHSLATPGGSMSPIHYLQSPATPAAARPTSTTVTATTTSSRDGTTGGAVGLLRRMSQAAFGDGGDYSEVSTPNRGSVANSSSEGRDRENSVGS